MLFKDFAETADTINSESGNIAKEKHISDMLQDADDDSLDIVPRFIQGRIFPLHDEQKLRVSTSLMRQAISESTGVEEDVLKDAMPEVDDMGELFDKFDIQRGEGQQTLGQQSVTVSEVFDVLTSIAGASGAGSQQQKVDYLVSLLSRCTSIEAKYLTRLVLEKMSIGVGEGTVRKAIARAYNVPETRVERALMLTNDTGHVARVAADEGEEGLAELSLNVGTVPLQPMKAKASEVVTALDDMGTDQVYGEYKYDGFRIQAHKTGDEVRLFTRRLEDVTSSLPDVVEFVKEHVTDETVILDGEVVGYESTNFETPLPYQQTQRRIRRKHDIQEMIDEIPVQPHFFDILYHENDGLLIDEPFESRLSKLQNVCSETSQAVCVKCTSVSDLQDVMTKAENDGHEGAMVKHPEATYEPNSRGKRWMKLKPAGETIDAAVIGGTYGDGRRSNFIASYELGIWNQDTGELESVGDVGTGFTDKEFEDMTDRLEPEIIEQDGRELVIRPSVVFEVEFEEVQPSPEYESGYGLRFPRFIRTRGTKSVDDADSIERLENIAERL